jgi:Ca2+-binding RTX toxin-like protein
VLGRAGGNETFAMQAIQSSAAPVIQAGGTNNTLDYSAYVGDIGVNLRLGTATALAGISGIQNVTGSQGNNLLVGDANANVLRGGTGRNVIIGGAGADQLFGGGGDNLLISGTTAYDTNTAALDAIFQEWLQPVSFDTRVNALRKGIQVNGVTYKLDKTTVFADGAADQTTAGGGNNWYFLDSKDPLPIGLKGTDRITRV